MMAALLACSVWPERPEPPALHDFGVARPGDSGFPWSEAEVTAPEWLQDTRLRYRLLYSRPTEVRSYSRDRWVAPPAALLAQRLNDSHQIGSCRLRIELQSFEQIFAHPGDSRVTLVFQAMAYSNGKDKPVAERSFRFDLQAPSADAAGAVQSFPRLIERAISALRDWAMTIRPSNYTERQ